ncbi:hypothetical protein [Stappia sp. MMSF_3263]|uniref:hypothetical protein n=1 Tax=Stappia sp. MMSF_3263 TaxID=3046693 RepID=UPI00273D596C|nr:hypothetical protein [Stappia sp. MMSF_3263]
MDRLQRCRAVSKLVDDALRIGCGAVETGNEVSDFELIAKSFEKGVVGEHLNRRINTLPPNQVLWIVARDRNGIPIGTMAARYDIVQGWDLAHFIREYWARAYTGVGKNPVEIEEESLRYAKGIQGPWVYIGEGFVESEFRNKGISKILIQILILLSFDEYNPSLIYGWMRPNLINRGINTSWGFHNTIYPGVRWMSAPKQADLKDLAFVSCDSAGVDRIARNKLQNVEDSKTANIQSAQVSHQ